MPKIQKISEDKLHFEKRVALERIAQLSEAAYALAVQIRLNDNTVRAIDAELERRRNDDEDRA
jgi:hypothetical protein